MASVKVVPLKFAQLSINVTLLENAMPRLVNAPTPTRLMDLLATMAMPALKPIPAELEFVLVVTPRFALHLIRVTLLVSANLHLVFVATLTRPTAPHVMMVTRVLARILALLVSVLVETPSFAKLRINVTKLELATLKLENVPIPRKSTVQCVTTATSVQHPILVKTVSVSAPAKYVVAPTEVAAVLA